jgi:hypothetical protein
MPNASLLRTAPALFSVNLGEAAIVEAMDGRSGECGGEGS